MGDKKVPFLKSVIHILMTILYLTKRRSKKIYKSCDIPLEVLAKFAAAPAKIFLVTRILGNKSIIFIFIYFFGLIFYCFNLFEPLKVVLIKLVAVLMMSVKVAVEIQSFFGQTGTHIKPTKAPLLLVPSGEISKVCFFRYSKNGFPGSVCSKISL